jgi:hypothetical protein
VPALKKAGIEEFTVYQTLIGDTSEFVIVRPLPSLAEFDGPGALERALGKDKADVLEAKLRDCIISMHRSIENRRDELFLDPGSARALFMSRYRALPGKAREYELRAHRDVPGDEAGGRRAAPAVSLAPLSSAFCREAVESPPTPASIRRANATRIT